MTIARDDWTPSWPDTMPALPSGLKTLRHDVGDALAPGSAPSADWRQALADRSVELCIAIGLVSALVLTSLFVDILQRNVERGERIRAAQQAHRAALSVRDPRPVAGFAAFDTAAVASSTGAM